MQTSNYTQPAADPPVARRRRFATAGLVGVGSGLATLARLVLLVAALVFAVIALAIVLRVLDANGANSLALNWGIAALLYLIAGRLVARALAARRGP